MLLSGTTGTLAPREALLRQATVPKTEYSTGQGVCWLLPGKPEIPWRTPNSKLCSFPDDLCSFPQCGRGLWREMGTISLTHISLTHLHLFLTHFNTHMLHPVWNKWHRAINWVFLQGYFSSQDKSFLGQQLSFFITVKEERRETSFLRNEEEISEKHWLCLFSLLNMTIW